MHRNISITLVIPCLNEEDGIRMVLQNVPAQVDEILVIDAGSQDRTREIAESFPRTRVILEPRRGYGLAYKRGFHEAKSAIIAAADGDGTYPCPLIPAMVDHMLDNSLDFISGTRFPLKDPKAMSATNFVGNKLITFFFNLLFQTHLADGLSGMWVFRKNISDVLQFESDDWNFSPEIKLAVLSTPRFKLGEYHIPYAERNGVSKLMPWSVGLSNVLFLLRRRLFASPPPRP